MHPNESSNLDSFLVLARPADTLTALVTSMLARHRADIAFCSSAYDVFAALQKVPQERHVILITRPSMLARPNLLPVLRQYSKLRLVGWLSGTESPSDPAVLTLREHGIVMVSTVGQLRGVIAGRDIAAVREPAQRDPEIRKQDSTLDSPNYRLSDEELDALLGAG